MFPRKRSTTKSLRLEQLELRCTPTVVCDANPTYSAECEYLKNLIPANAITDTAVKSGNWSDPTTWGGRLPGNGDNVWIPIGVTVTVDGQEPGALRSVLDNGLLQFANNVNTSLLVDTIVVGTDDANGNPHGELDIGTTAHPIQPGVKAVVTFADTGTLTQAWPSDPNQLARGLISMNTVSIVGATVTPYEQVTGGVQAGSKIIILASAPTGWHVGDTLLFPGASPTANQDEQIAIQAIAGNLVTLATPLAFSHASPAGQPVYVADEARNVVFQSQNTSDYERFGHVMFMHSDQEVVENAAFLHLGRTDKALPFGTTNPDGTKNVVGRYAVHFHRDYWPTLSQNDPSVLVSGNFEMGSPGWGYDNHSSNVDMEDNVAFQNNGAGFVTEAGNEIGTFNANLAVRTTGVANGTDYGVVTSRINLNDFGFTGSGFWMQSPSCTLTNNIALDDTAGFQFYNQALSAPGLGTLAAWNGQVTTSVALTRFSANSAAESTDGVELFWHLPANVPVAPGTQSVIENLTAWDVNVGLDFGQWAARVTVQNSSLSAAPGSGLHSTGVRTVGGGYASGIQLANDHVTGFGLGASSPSIGIDSVSGGYWDDATAFEITQQQSTAGAVRQLSYSGISFGPNVHTQYQWDSQTAEERDDPNSDFTPQMVFINGVQAYFANQGASYIPFPAADANVPAALVGLTNAQLMQKYGLAMEDEIASQQSQAAPFWYGLNPYKSPVKVSSSSYTLSYYTPQGVVTESTPITLQPGWNLITRIVNGAPHSWLVGYNAPSAPPVPQDSISGSQTINGAQQTMPTSVTSSGSLLRVTATSSQGAGQIDLTIINSGIEWDLVLGANGALYIEKNGKIIGGGMISTSSTNSFDLSLDTSRNAFSVVINGTKYL
jgi:hypothetical protein